MAHALETAPQLLTSIVVSCAGWIEQLDSHTWNLIGFDRTYRELPPWLPIEAIKTLAVDVLADDQGLDDTDILNALLQRTLDEAV